MHKQISGKLEKNKGIRARYFTLNISTKGEKTKIRFLFKDLLYN